MFFFGALMAVPAYCQVTLEADILKIDLDGKGYFKGIAMTGLSKNYLCADTVAPFITLVSDRERYFPSSLDYEAGSKTLVLSFDKIMANVEVKVSCYASHIAFEVSKAEPAAQIDGLVWGPIPTTVSETIGEIIGVVRDDDVGLGIQVLNPKTLGGDYNPEGMTWARGEAAVKKRWGSLLQAYSINRDRFRFVDTWGGEFINTPVKPIEGETVVGSKIAIFICKEPETLDYIEQIAIVEGLPHATMNGVWVKKGLQQGRSYLIADFKESEIDEMIAYTKRAGLISLYHEGPFLNWGHYDLNPEYFPGGKEGIRKCAQKTREAGLFFGVHTLTNFITTNDPYVTPVPDPRLAITGFGLLTETIDERDNEIPVSTKEYFDKQVNNWLHTVRIGSELIRYRAVTETEPFLLLDCQRGAFGTVPSSHAKNDTVAKLYDHAYEVFFPNLEMQREIAVNLARFFNETGINHLDFDGHEGCLASGQGDYAINLFALDFYNNLDHEVLNGTSLSKTFYWHINTFCNWGEPWNGGFKESMQEYRINNQALFDRNYIPHMLGWYLLTKNTILSEMEWMLARAAGYDAGFAMVARPESIRNNPVSGTLLDVIREWENARLSGAFSEDQKERMKNTGNEFHLEKTGDSEWNLYQYSVNGAFSCIRKERQPGEPPNEHWEFFLGSFEQPLQFRIEIAALSDAVRNIKIILDSYLEINVEQELFAGESMVCDGSDLLRVYDEKGKFKNTIKLKSALPEMKPGNHSITFSCDFPGEESPRVDFIVRSMNYPEKIKAAK